MGAQLATRDTNAWVDESLWLQAHPGEWRTVTECATSAAAVSLVWRIRHGALYAFRPAGHYAARLAGREVVACYWGEDE